MAALLVEDPAFILSSLEAAVEPVTGGRSDWVASRPRRNYERLPLAREMQSDHKPYVLVTAARDEVDFIVLTIESVVAQTVLPLKWVVVSDGSS